MEVQMRQALTLQRWRASPARPHGHSNRGCSWGFLQREPADYCCGNPTWVRTEAANVPIRVNDSLTVAASVHNLPHVILLGTITCGSGEILVCGRREIASRDKHLSQTSANHSTYNCIQTTMDRCGCGHPVIDLNGHSCRNLCGPTWDSCCGHPRLLAVGIPSHSCYHRVHGALSSIVRPLLTKLLTLRRTQYLGDNMQWFKEAT